MPLLLSLLLCTLTRARGGECSDGADAKAALVLEVMDAVRKHPGGVAHEAVEYRDGGIWATRDLTVGETIFLVPTELQIRHVQTSEALAEILDAAGDADSPNALKMKSMLLGYYRAVAPTAPAAWRGRFNTTDAALRRAHFLLESRAFNAPRMGREDDPPVNTAQSLVPLVDLANHKPTKHANSLMTWVTTTGAAHLKVTRSTAGGTELFQRYFVNADVVEKARQYAFFDASHDDHAVGQHAKVTFGDTTFDAMRAGALGELGWTLNATFGSTSNWGTTLTARKDLLLRDEDGELPRSVVRASRICAATTTAALFGDATGQAPTAAMLLQLRRLMRDAIERAQHEEGAPEHENEARRWKRGALESFRIDRTPYFTFATAE